MGIFHLFTEPKSCLRRRIYCPLFTLVDQMDMIIEKHLTGRMIVLVCLYENENFPDDSYGDIKHE